MKNRRFRSIFVIAVVLVFALAVAACSSKPAGPTVVQVELSEYTIIMDQTSIPAGPVLFEITNNGTQLHEVVLEPAGTKDEPFDLNGVESEAEDIEPGAKATLEWTITDPGEYQLSCYVLNEGETQDHAEQGMITTFTVTP